MRRSIRLAIAASAALVTLAFAGSAWAAYSPSLIATSLSNAPGKPTTMLLGHAQGADDDPTAKDTVYAPLGYQANLTQPVGTKIGDLSGDLILRNLGNTHVAVKEADSHIFVDDPALYTAQASVCTPGQPLHEAVWRADLTVAGSPLHVPIYVDHVTSAPENAFASVKIQLCLQGPYGIASGAQLLFVLFDVNGVFTNPANTTPRLWRGIFMPYDPATQRPHPAGITEGQALVPGKVSLKLSAKSLRHGKAIISGRLLVDGKPFPGATVDLYVGSRRVARVKTKANGRFSVTKRIRKKTRYRALVAYVGDLAGCPAPPLPTVPQGCRTATIGFGAVSNGVTARRRR
jgi:hypothetical protein